MMKSMLLATALVASAFAQTPTSQAMPVVATQSFNPALINSTVALQWCTGQHNVCNALCNNRITQNICSETMFTYSCVCANGTVPDVTAYKESLPFYICDATFMQCLNLHPSTDPDGQAMCINDHQCGNLTAMAAATTSASTTSSSATGTAASTSAASTTSAGNAGVAVTPASTGAFAALLFALCGLVL